MTGLSHIFFAALSAVFGFVADILLTPAGWARAAQGWCHKRALSARARQ